MEETLYNIASLREFFAKEHCNLLSDVYENQLTPLQYQCCCGNKEVHTTNLKTFLTNKRCNGYQCRRSIPELNTIPTHKVCSTCNNEKIIDEFAVEKRATYTNSHKNTCRDCLNKINEKYRNTFQGYMKNLLKAAKQRAKLRAEKGRGDDVGTFSLSYDDIIKQWETQKGRCFYSNVPMVTCTKSDFQASLERIDTSRGYVVNNVVLCCLEFNDAIQWSKDKFVDMFTILNTQQYNVSEVHFTYKKRVPNTHMQQEYDKANYYQCNKCLTVKPLQQFNKNKSIGCKECVKELDQQRMNNPREALLLMLKNARNNTLKRSKKYIYKNRNNVIDIKLEDLIDIYKRQNGLCAYSGLPLMFGNSKEINWKISLERKDVLLGYTKDNVCFICYEFNTGDKTVLYNDDSKGSCGWSAEKFQVVMRYASEIY